MKHFLEKIIIKNYKSIQNIELDLSQYTPLVGYNNAGKSNILEAINWLIKKSKLKNSDFNDTESKVEVSAKVAGISESLLEKIEKTHRNKIEPYIDNESIQIKRLQPEPKASTSKIKLHIRNPKTGKWDSNPTGIDNAIKDIFPEPIYIGAMEDSEEDVSKSKTSTTIGKLLSKIINPIEEKYGDELKNTLNDLSEVLGINGENRAEELNEFDTSVNKKLNDFFPDLKVKVDIPSPKIKEIFSKGTIKVVENHLDEPLDISYLGHGAQRSIQMTLIRHLADIKKESNENLTTTLLLIDEPELYLHPQAIEILRLALKTLSEEGYQIIFSTHSPFIVNQDDIANTLLIRKNDKTGTNRRRTLKSAIYKIESENKHQLSLIFALSNSSNILFSEKVILVEGKTENKLLPFLIEELTSKSLGIHKCALVKLQGCKNTKKSKDVLEVMDLPTKALVDFDYCFTQAIKDDFISTDDEDIITCKDKMKVIAESHDIELNDGLPTKKNSSMSVPAAYALLAQDAEIQGNIKSLKEKLLKENIWIWTKGTIEEHLNLKNKNEQAWAELKSNIKENGMESTLNGNFKEVKNCLEWLTN